MLKRKQAAPCLRQATRADALVVQLTGHVHSFQKYRLNNPVQHVSKTFEPAEQRAGTRTHLQHSHNTDLMGWYMPGTHLQHERNTNLLYLLLS